jgi:hypothetical protein
MKNIILKNRATNRPIRFMYRHTTNTTIKKVI